MTDSLIALKKREAWIEKVGVKNVEFSHLLDIFRDEREDIKLLLARVEKCKCMEIE